MFLGGKNMNEKTDNKTTKTKNGMGDEYFVIPNAWSSAGDGGAPGRTAHIMRKPMNSEYDLSFDGFYATLCKPHAWCATNWLTSKTNERYPICQRCLRKWKRMGGEIVDGVLKMEVA